MNREGEKPEKEGKKENDYQLVSYDKRQVVMFLFSIRRKPLDLPPGGRYKIRGGAEENGPSISYKRG